MKNKQELRMITRPEAVVLLSDIAECPFLDEMVSEALYQIVDCIITEHELGIHEWGAPESDINILHEGTIESASKKDKDAAEKVSKKYKFSPSEFEVQWAKDNPQFYEDDEDDNIVDFGDHFLGRR